MSRDRNPYASMQANLTMIEHARVANQNPNQSRELTLDDYVSPNLSILDPYAPAKDDTHRRNDAAQVRVRVRVRAAQRAIRSYVPLHENDAPNGRWYGLFDRTTGQMMARIFGSPAHIVSEVRHAATILRVSITDFYLKAGV